MVIFAPSFAAQLHAREAVLLGPVAAVAAVAVIGGRPLLRKTLPFGTAVSLCLVLGAWGEELGFAWFQASSAVVVVALLMEPNITLERLILKSSWRLCGTFLGSALAVLMAWALEITGKEPLEVTCLCFSAFLGFGMVQVFHSKDAAFPFISSVTCITCAVLMFGFMAAGWALIFGQIASVLVGEMLSLSSSLLCQLMLPDASSLSLVFVVRTSQQILDQTVTALELIFMSQVAVLRTSGSTSPARQFRLAGRGSTLGEGSLQLASYLAEASSQRGDLTDMLGRLEEEEAILQSRCRMCLSDMRFINLAGWLDAHQVDAELVQEVHRLFLQACALSHLAAVRPLDAESWLAVGPCFQQGRKHMKVALECLKSLLESAKAFGSKGEKEQELERLCSGVENARVQLKEAWAAFQQLPAERRACAGHAAAALCQGFDSILVDIASCAQRYTRDTEWKDLEVRLQNALKSPPCMT